ncbi:MAG: TetR/AcrR family transcriptional regulator, partial [Thermoleophilaceae bacterium]
MQTAGAAAALGRREELKAQNRAKLLAAARKVFAEKGLGAATARDIVRETDLATGTFYNYFEDKNDAFRALISEHAAKGRQV